MDRSATGTAGESEKLPDGEGDRGGDAGSGDEPPPRPRHLAPDNGGQLAGGRSREAHFKGCECHCRIAVFAADFARP